MYTAAKILFLLAYTFFSMDYEQMERYIDPIFPKVKKETCIYDATKEEKLALDIYTPIGDILPVRPALIWMHGGGFSSGQRDDLLEVKFMELLASRGYVAISISYELRRKGMRFDCDTPQIEKLQIFREASKDLWKAISFIVDHAGQFKIDTTKIIIGGASAGAEAVLHAIYMKDWVYDTTDEIPTFNPIGVFACGGAMIDANYITRHNSIGAVLFHGIEDDKVPYETASHHYCKPNKSGYLILDGARPIANRLKDAGNNYLLYSFEGAGHEIANIPFPYIQEVLTFFKTTFIEGQARQEEVIIPVEARSYYMTK